MVAEKSGIFASGRRESTDSDFNDCGSSLEPQSTNMSTDVPAWSSSPSIPRRETQVRTFAEPTPATDAGKLLVEEMWEALQQHVESSFAKLFELTNNPLAVRLRRESPVSIATKGFESLRSILHGKDPSDPLHYLCFVHVVYAFSLVLHEDELVEQSELLFKQALAYRSFLTPSWYDCYSEIVSRIWNPEVHAGFQAISMLPSHQRLSGRVGAHQFRTSPESPLDKDALATVSQDFLDEFESLVINSKSMRPADILSSALWSTHMDDLRTEHGSNQPFIAGAHYIINVLVQSFRDSPGISQRLRCVGQRVHNRDTSTVRRLEMELMQAGKGILAPSHFFGKFVPQVRRHCNDLYSKHSGNPRFKYHILAASFAEKLLYDAARESATPPTQATQPPTLPMNLPGSLDDLFNFQPIDGAFDVEGGMNNFLQPLPEQGSPQFNFTSSATPLSIGLASSHVNVTPLQATSETNFSTDFVCAGVSTPGLMTGSHSSSIVAPTEPSDAQASISPRKNPQKARSRQRERKKAPAPSHATSVSSSEQVAQPSTASPATEGTQVEANSCCEICGYRPKGDPQWFKGSMAKHRKLQHSTDPPTIYQCPFPGCTSAYKNRQDNLRQHQIEKNHFVDDDGQQQKRPHKRRRVS
ncbi:hypothetical protein Micbo1qcDRAFT_233641 [Microdochium bolleyi]|uniref:Uncharacterized protein n=1 Tax=Microdochium bolleyi TaxID=196109 RepID=A0A136J5F3_9PEZI|nr:hypothetical protein Micbo1qcDRAFT_233641 [Microdochium bolleyi]